MIRLTLSPAPSAQKCLRHGLYWNSISVCTWRTHSPVHTVELNFAGDPHVVTISESFMSLRHFRHHESPCQSARAFCCLFLKEFRCCFVVIVMWVFPFLVTLECFVVLTAVLLLLHEALLGSIRNSASCSQHLSAHIGNTCSNLALFLYSSSWEWCYDKLRCHKLTALHYQRSVLGNLCWKCEMCVCFSWPCVYTF